MDVPSPPSATRREVEPDALATWLSEQGVGTGPVSDLTALEGGTQNTLIRFTHDGRDLVLRMPPPHKRPNSDQTMRREAQVLAALAGSDVPHPELVAAEADTELFGCAFFVMAAVDGIQAAGELEEPYSSDAAWRHEIGPAMARAIASLGAIDAEIPELDGLGKPGSFNERQVGRWRSQLEGYSTVEGYEPIDPALTDPLTTWLTEHRPADQTPGILHGDFHPGNVLLSTSTPGLAAVVDWELSTIGEPLLDLGQLLVSWPDPSAGSSLGGPLIQPTEGLATHEELIEIYAEGSDRDLGQLDWFRVLAAYRLAAILEGTWARFAQGRADEATGRFLHQTALALFEGAHRLLDDS